jgi:hypothetical protein
MKNKIFLSSMLIMSVAPAMAETFPSNGLMQENKTYTNAATETNMAGVYEGSVNATAEYETINYLLNAGQYLPADSETITTCPAGSFCAGGTTVQYNQTTAQGIQTCPTGYANSADGASADTQCYRACDINNMGTSFTNIAHATAVSGNDYYGNGTDTCEPTGCDNGYHVAGSSTLTTEERQKLQYIASTPEAQQYILQQIRQGGGFENSLDSQDTEYLKKGEFFSLAPLSGGKAFFIFGEASCNNYKGTFEREADHFDFESDALKSPRELNTNLIGNSCWCRIKYAREATESVLGEKENDKSSDWVNVGIYSDSSSCLSDCVNNCTGTFLFGYDYYNNKGTAMDRLVETMTYTKLSCDANTININWLGADDEDITANNAGTAKYDGDIRTPVKAQTIKGKTFKGWRFSKPTETNLPK